MQGQDMNQLLDLTQPGQQKPTDRALLYPNVNIVPSTSPPLRIGVMASGNGTNFEALIQAINSGWLSAEIPLLVVNNPDCMAQKRAKAHGIAVKVVDHRGYSNRQALDRQLVNLFQSNQVDVVVMAGWMRIVTDVLVNGFSERLINIHPSLLPSFRGLDGVGQALQAGVCISGCTVHLVTTELDAGPILSQAAVPVLDDDDHKSLARRIQMQEHILLPATLQQMAHRWRQG
ncbi:phosphoribosylglycinamide formyltransferase [Synechococcus sp. M16CYN]|uniref:phosphoribosylglycinamide formyltransferase n=1 Tax=Synechococcus sp. M16CYN TaxID=3103139 RepID=UPI0030E3A261